MTADDPDTLNTALEALLADPLIRAVMAADGIEMAEMRELLEAAWIAAQARQVVPPSPKSIEDAERYARK